MNSDDVRKRVIIALVSDDSLMEQLVLKGGNAVAIMHGLATRASIDIDFSIEGAFEDVDAIRATMTHCLTTTFAEDGMVVFDISLSAKPAQVSSELQDFWGGYQLRFKILDSNEYERYRDAPGGPSRVAMVVGPSQRRTFTVDISGHEYCGSKMRMELEGYYLYVYPPTLIVVEKIRAVCQQMPEYRRLVMNHLAPRAKDFFDIHNLCETCDIDVSTEWELLKIVFAAKRVPLHLLGRISDCRNDHREAFEQVRQTIAPSVLVQDFDFYVDALIKRLAALEPRWME